MSRVMRNLALACLIVAGGAVLVWAFQDAVFDFVERGREVAFGPAPEEAALAPTVEATLYFADAEEDVLAPHPAEVEIGEDDVHTLRNALEALIEGPKEEGRAPILPPGTKLRAVFPGAGGAAYVDFDKTFREAHPGGAWAELMTAYGVAAVVIRNFPHLFDRVTLLVEGQEAQTVAGSLAITGPLRLREDLMAKRPGAGASAGAAGSSAGRTPPAGEAPVRAVGAPRGEPDVGAVGAPEKSR